MKCIARMLSMLLLLSAISQAQESNRQEEKMRFFVEPIENVLSVIAHQPGCPIEFQEVSFLSLVGGGGGPDYRIRNISDKPITEFKIAVLAFGGGGPRITFKAEKPSQWLMPGEMWLRPKNESGKDSSRIEIVPLTDQLRERYKVGPPMKGIVIFMVVRTVFSDGSVYSDETVYKELQKLLEKIEPPGR